MNDEGVRALIVASAGSDLVAGVITDLDLLRAVIEGQTEGMASDVMTLEPPPSISAADSLGAAVARLREGASELLLVTDGSPPRPIGVLGYSDIAAHLAGH